MFCTTVLSSPIFGINVLRLFGSEKSDTWALRNPMVCISWDSHNTRTSIEIIILYSPTKYCHLGVPSVKINYYNPAIGCWKQGTFQKNQTTNGKRTSMSMSHKTDIYLGKSQYFINLNSGLKRGWFTLYLFTNDVQWGRSEFVMKFTQTCAIYIYITSPYVTRSMSIFNISNQIYVHNCPYSIYLTRSMSIIVHIQYI